MKSLSSFSFSPPITPSVADGNGNLISNYIYAGRTSPFMRLDAKGNPVYYLTDAMGSVIGLADGSGSSVGQFVYDGFGNLRNDSSNVADVTGGDFRFQGQWRESESGLYYFRARDYDAHTGKFISRDPVDLIEIQPESFNPYQFVYNNPYVYSDPTGMITISEVQIRQVIDDILNGLHSQAVNRTQSYLIDKARGIASNIIMSWMQKVIPTEATYITKIAELIGKAKDAGDPLEKMVMDNLCPIFEGMGLEKWIWREPAILAANGKPVSNGYPCGGDPIPTSKFPKGLQPGSTAKPDFVISRYAPMDTKDTKLSPIKGLLVGDFKINVSKAGDYVNKNKTQWQSMANFAKFRQSVPFTMFITFFDAQSTSQIQLLQKKALSQDKVNLFILPLASINGK